MRLSLIRLGFLLFICSRLISSAHAFSDNNVRVNRFNWMKVQTEHFDIYYDKGTEQLVPSMAKYLEDAWKEAGRLLNVQVKERTPFFFYSNHNEFEQTNIVSIGEGTGGVTEAFKNRFLVFNDGSQTWLRHVIYHEFGHVIQFNVLYGGFWRSIRLLKSPFYPLWFMEGMAEYASGSIDEPTGDMVVRDAVAYNKLPELPELQGFAHLKPNQITLGYKTGEAAMNFLADEYGPEKVGELLVLMKDHFDISSALDQLLGIDLVRFDFRFHEYMNDKYAAHLARAKKPDFYGDQLTFNKRIPEANDAPVVSPDGKTIYYMGDRAGPTLVYKLDMATKKSKAVMRIDWGRFENIHTKGRALSISPDGRWLAFAGEKKQQDFLYFLDLKKKRLRKIKVPFDEIRNPVFSRDGESLVCVGMMRGFNDLYLIDRKAQVIKRLTNNPQDERDPVFSSDGRTVYFSGEMIDAEMSPVGRDLFALNIEDGSVEKLTDYWGEETEPEVLPNGDLVFVRDRDDDGRIGFNIHRLKVGEKLALPVTDAVGGAFSPRVLPGTGLAYIAFNDGNRHVYTYKMSEEQAPTPVANSAEPEPGLEWGDAPLKARPQGVSVAMSLWPDPAGLGSPAPYRFKASTDLFLPFFYYSTQEGLVAADIWQFSDYLGNHQIQQQMQYASGNDFINTALFYTYARFRPQFTVGFQKVQYYRDIDNQHQRSETSGIALVSYPLDRINSVNAGYGITNRDDEFFDESEPNEFVRERFWLAGFVHDTVTGRYLVATKGNRTSLSYQEGSAAFNGEEDYRSGAFETVQYVPVPGESTVVGRFIYGRSTGEDAHVFRLGGVDRVRGFPSGSLQYKRSNVVLSSLEARIRLKYLNARTKFLFPDFFFKAAYLVMFTDVGYGWDNLDERDHFDSDNALNSAGAGISWPTFILQSFQLNLTVQWAKRTTDGSDLWYITVGPQF